MSPLPEKILSRARSFPEGGVLSPRELRHLGSRSAVGKALSRLVQSGQLLRVARGSYVASVAGRFGSRPPAPERVVRSLAEQTGEVVVAHGASAANVLGLTQQVPIREVYLTSGRTRKLKLGRTEVLVKHAPSWMLALGSRPAGEAVRALAWIGKAQARESLASLRRRLPVVEWNALASAGRFLPGWLAEAIGKEAKID